MKAKTHTTRFFEELEQRRLLSVSPTFDLGAPDTAPFPSDRFTVTDASQLTGRRVAPLSRIPSQAGF
jgi:hypothetical protein